MNLFEPENDWSEKLNPLIKKYKGIKHPLNYNNKYELLVMVILSAQDSDANINKIAPALFQRFPTIETVATSTIDELIPYISKVRNFGIKANWIIDIANTIKLDENIPLTMQNLTALKGIGRKSANVIIREAKKPAEGIIVDLHVIRVAPRIGISTLTKDGNNIEKQLMQILPKIIWTEIGMALSFLGREICRPTNPKCNECIINIHCNYYKQNF
jgi:endonuclease-3